jgi:ubiquinone/menaquinone biosynthesis C-methylase UbiE
MAELPYHKNRDGFPFDLKDYDGDSIVGYIKDLFPRTIKGFKASRILDIGCGKGEVVDAGIRGGLEIIGIDIRRSIYQGNKTRFIQADVRNLPFQNHSFDMVFQHLIFEDMEGLQRLPFLEIEKGIREVYRVLTPRGFVFNHMCASWNRLGLFEVVLDCPPDTVYQKISAQNP